ncbi:MAG TPA: type II toxin-antitoxin system VapC family toxin [Thermoanaerobaculia bacterium]|nr:type II toxin-antitoxin system VapC family toxin [Thermoanaerobaculia bacterium]
MTYLLDTNACIGILNGTVPALVSCLKEKDTRQVRLCSVVKAELLHGARKSARVAENLTLLARFFTPFASLPFDDRAADHYGQIRADLERSGIPIGPHDLLIAAIARAHDVTLVTHNLREFTRVVGLRVEDWEAG